MGGSPICSTKDLIRNHGKGRSVSRDLAWPGRNSSKEREMKEIPRSQRYPGHPPLDRLFAEVQNGNRHRRNEQIAEDHIACGYTLKEIADFHGVHYTMVSNALISKVTFQDLIPIEPHPN
jgi:hypothetical protein